MAHPLQDVAPELAALEEFLDRLDGRQVNVTAAKIAPVQVAPSPDAVAQAYRKWQRRNGQATDTSTV